MLVAYVLYMFIGLLYLLKQAKQSVRARSRGKEDGRRGGPEA